MFITQEDQCQNTFLSLTGATGSNQKECKQNTKICISVKFYFPASQDPTGVKQSFLTLNVSDCTWKKVHTLQ